MMRLSLIAALLGLLVACGVDGKPEAPEPEERPVGVTVTGRAAVGAVF
ncbi:argininosuccinate lyase [Pseudooceanicola sp.]